MRATRHQHNIPQPNYKKTTNDVNNKGNNDQSEEGEVVGKQKRREDKWWWWGRGMRRRKQRPNGPIDNAVSESTAPPANSRDSEPIHKTAHESKRWCVNRQHNRQIVWKAEHQLRNLLKYRKVTRLGIEPRTFLLKYRNVTRPGIEPRTFWTYTRCSNQLSYLALEFNQLILYLCNCQPKDTYSARHI